MSDPSDYYLDKAKLTIGVKMYLVDRHGKQTKDWLMIRSVHSDEVRKALDDQARGRREGTISGDDVCWDAVIAGWSFEQPCTPDAVREFLSNAPQFKAGIDRVTGELSRFFPDSGKSS